MKKAYSDISDAEPQDDAEAFEWWCYATNIEIVKSQDFNFKITFPEDLKMAEWVLKNRAN